MEIKLCQIEGLVEIQPKVFRDDRGYFFESYNKSTFENLGIVADFVQDNQSLSQKWVLRGLHFQAPPFDQGKLVRVVSGKVWDVAVDIRKNSPTYGHWHAVTLDAQRMNMFWIPPGFAHGFVTLEDNTVFSYKCTNVYNKASEGAVRWNDPQLNISWNIENPLLSEKDAIAPLLADLKTPFNY